MRYADAVILKVTTRIGLILLTAHMVQSAHAQPSAAATSSIRLTSTLELARLVDLTVQLNRVESSHGSFESRRHDYGWDARP